MSSVDAELLTLRFFKTCCRPAIDRRTNAVVASRMVGLLSVEAARCTPPTDRIPSGMSTSEAANCRIVLFQMLEKPGF